MLVLEVAAGALLALILYRAVDSFYKRHFVTMSAALLMVLYFVFAAIIGFSFAGFLLIGIYLMLARPEYVRNHHSAAIWIIVVFLVVGAIFAIPYAEVVKLKARLVRRDKS